MHLPCPPVYLARSGVALVLYVGCAVAPPVDRPRPSHAPARRACALFLLLFTTACASAPATRSGSLKSYEGLVASNGVQTKSQIRVDKAAVLAAKTVSITPTRVAAGVGADLSEENRALVANRLDRALCRDLGRRLQVVAAGEAADLKVQATITHLGATSRFAAAGSVVASYVSVVPMVSPRVPYGLGSLTVEAEAVAPGGDQEVAIIWSRKAQPLEVMGGAIVSEVGDAYQFASAFGGDFSKLVLTGETPFGRPSVRLPEFGRKTSAACEAFGKGAGVAGFVSENLGLPPGWTDKGARKEPKQRPAYRP